MLGYLQTRLLCSESNLDKSNLFQLLVFSGFYLAFGYSYNDWTDRKIDRNAGKKNIIGELALPHAMLFLIALSTCSLVILWNYLSRFDVLFVVSLSYGLAFAYSSPAIRLKEHGWIGLVAASITQRCLPCLLVFVINDCITQESILYLILLFILGLRWMIIHQLDDYDNDKKSQTYTYVTQAGREKAQSQLPRLFAFELLLIGYILYRSVLNIPESLWILVIYGAFTMLMTWATKETWWQMLKHPSSAYFVLLDFYFLYWPLGLALLWTIHQPDKFWYCILLAIWLHRYVKQHITDLQWLLATLHDPASK